MMGRNVASYKFALAASLIELSSRGSDFLSLEDVAAPFSRNLCEHLRHSAKQITSSRSRFIDSCRRANEDEISQDALIESTVRLGFVNVIDAFHVVNKGDTPIRFFVDDRKTKGGITITDDFFKLAEGGQFHNLPREVEARWNLVEKAWELNMSPNHLDVECDVEGGQMYVLRRDTSRVNLTTSKDALNAYQKGQCFYCFKEISIEPKSERLAHVDHFLPHRLKEGHEIGNLDGIWNLVLACQECNSSKSSDVPHSKYLDRLNKRNNYLITSHRPLRETLMQQTGIAAPHRREFLNKVHQTAVHKLIHTWGPSEEYGASF